MLVRRRSVLFLVEYDRAFRCPLEEHVDFALKAVRKRWWRWRCRVVSPAFTGYVMGTCSCTVCRQGLESGYRKIGAHQHSPLTAKDLGRLLIARRARKYQGGETLCAHTCSVELPIVGGESQVASIIKSGIVNCSSEHHSMLEKQCQGGPQTLIVPRMASLNHRKRHR